MLVAEKDTKRSRIVIVWWGNKSVRIILQNKIFKKILRNVHFALAIILPYNKSEKIRRLAEFVNMMCLSGHTVAKEEWFGQRWRKRLPYFLVFVFVFVSVYCISVIIQHYFAFYEYYYYFTALYFTIYNKYFIYVLVITMFICFSRVIWIRLFIFHKYKVNGAMALPRFSMWGFDGKG